MHLRLRHPCFKSFLRIAPPMLPYRNTYAATQLILRNYADDRGKETKTRKELTDKVDTEKSYLEEILLEKEQEPKTTGQKVKRAAATSFYIAFGLASIAALGGLSYLLFKELFSFSSPQGLYKDALKRVKKDDRCVEIFGNNMLAHGEESGRGRRRHIANQRFQKDGQERLRIMFHIKGDRHVGRVHAEITKIDGTWDYRFLLVETDTAQKTIVLIDSR